MNLTCLADAIARDPALEERLAADGTIRRFMVRELTMPDGSSARCRIVVAAPGPSGHYHPIAVRPFSGETAMTSYVGCASIDSFCDSASTESGEIEELSLTLHQ